MKKEIYITTDIHNYMKYSSEHKAGFSKETEYLKKYLSLANKYSIKVTVFVSGLEIENNIDYYRGLIDNPFVELGGHTWDCYTRYFKGEGYIYKKIFGCAYGPSFFQRYDIKKTTKILKEIGVSPVSWRTHAYASNKDTRKILVKEGYKIISDISKEKYLSNNIIEAIPNILPDHENIIHKGIKNNPQARYILEEWFFEIKKEILNNDKSIILIHATCQKYLDDFKTLENLFKWINENKIESKLMREYKYD